MLDAVLVSFRWRFGPSFDPRSQVPTGDRMLPNNLLKLGTILFSLLHWSVQLKGLFKCSVGQCHSGGVYKLSSRQ